MESNVINEQTVREVVNTFYDILQGKKEGKIEELFSDKVDWDLPGNNKKYEWIGKRSTKQEVADYFNVLLPRNIKAEKFEIDFIAVEGKNAVAYGTLSSRVIKYDKLFNSDFATIFKIENGKICKYHFLEDSYKLSEITD